MRIKGDEIQGELYHIKAVGRHQHTQDIIKQLLPKTFVLILRIFGYITIVLAIHVMQQSRLCFQPLF